jgi:hypothetical protein
MQPTDGQSVTNGTRREPELNELPPSDDTMLRRNERPHPMQRSALNCPHYDH